MFDFVHEKKRAVQIILLLLILPFAFWGISSYRQSSGEALATIDGEDITQQEFDNAMRRMQGRVNPDNLKDKLAVLEQIANEKLLINKARAAGLEPTTTQLRDSISGMSDLQTDGKFDRSKYEAWLRSLNMTPKMLEAALKNDIAYRQITELYSQSAQPSGMAADNFAHALEQQRVVSLAKIAPDAFLKQVKVDEAATKKYYDESQAEFSTPERARVEYVIFSADPLLSQTSASADEIKKYYEDHKAEFTAPEQRHVAHILITPADKSGDAGKKAALEKAESVLKELKQSPASFADLAKKYSDDTGSKNKGGDLGLISRGMMPMKTFEDAVFGLKAGEFSNVVESDAGFHIIKVLEIKGGGATPLDEVKGNIATKIKMQKAGEKFAELSDKFNDAIYTQSDSLKPAAEVVKATVQQSGWLEKGQHAAYPWTDKALQAVFSEDVLKKKRNSAAIEIASDRLIAVHLLDYKPSGTQPYAEVAEAIKKKLVLKEASEMASRQGQDTLAQLQRGEKTSLKWVAEKDPVSRMRPAGSMDSGLARLVLQADTSKLPAYVGTANAKGEYLIARVDSVKDIGSIEEAKRAKYSMILRQALGDELLQAYVADAKKHASFKMRGFAASGKN
jgi:peptidyl-prolyl cis-trans isomerase D